MCVCPCESSQVSRTETCMMARGVLSMRTSTSGCRWMLCAPRCSQESSCRDVTPSGGRSDRPGAGRGTRSRRGSGRGTRRRRGAGRGTRGRSGAGRGTRRRRGHSLHIETHSRDWDL